MIKMQNSTGFTLITFSLYVSLFSLLSMLCFQWATRIMLNSKTMNYNTHTTTNIFMAYDVLMRDIHCAPQNIKWWKKITSTELIWKTEKSDIGWSFDGNTIKRSEGIYNAQRNTWKKRTTSIVARNISTLTFLLRKQSKKNVSAVSCTMVFNNNNSISTSIALRNRTI